MTLAFRRRLVFVVFRISYVIVRVNIVTCGTLNILRMCLVIIEGESVLYYGNIAAVT